MGRIENLRRWSGANWFLLALPPLVAAAALLVRSAAWSEEGATLEAVLLFDACVSLPALYALCYARALPPWQLALRMVGIACLGLFLLGHIVPPEAQRLLPRFGWARTIGVVVLVLVELRLFVAALRLLFGSGASAQQISARTGAPPWIARLMVMEARFWKAVWRLLRGR